MNIPYVMKKCTKCGRWLVASTVNFHKAKKGKYGLQSKCKECINKYGKRYRETNKEKVAESHKQYYEANKEKIAKRDKQYYEANRDRKAKYGKQYRQSPQGQVTIFNKHHRRRTKEGQQGTGITKDQWSEMMSFFDWKCAYSGETLTKDTRSIDHIVPLNSNGDNMIWNCVPMTRSLNSSKNDKDMLEWYRGQNFYSEARLEKIYKWQKYARKKWGK